MPTSLSIQAPIAFKGGSDVGGKEMMSPCFYIWGEQTAFMAFTTDGKIKKG